MEDYYKKYMRMLSKLDPDKDYNLFDSSLTLNDKKNILPLIVAQQWEEKLYDIKKFHYNIMN